MGAELSKAVDPIKAIAVAGENFQADQVMKDIGVNTQFNAKTLDSKANLSYQENFPDHVIHMFNDKVRTTSECEPERLHYFAVYHPGSETFAAIQNQLYERKEFIGCFNDLNELGTSLVWTRQSVGRKAILHVLLPSGHKYRIDNTIHIPPGILPLRIYGQTHLDGEPYVSAKFDVKGDFRSTGLEMMFRGRERLAANSLATIAGSSAGSALILVSGVLFFTPAAPLGLVGILATPVAAYFIGKACKDSVKSDMMKKKVGRIGCSRTS
ncbi:uncharacterized protein ALTATR162_LOCUS244 [Alternaria atra]|uniref:Uncharacterized protein n=1 Tax=Alternaria atra TaxID=119953 RepID=A0A8J2HV03_9PLEO|nr:uncharacterized protein ALTATR162_LOCUS244 [Alternaria atra]CAG5137905.1 unnamed protein product [Alternaria atra]